MRTYKDIFSDYLEWMAEKTGDSSYLYDNYIKQFEDENVAKASLYRMLLELCYHPEDGLYYFTKFIVGGLDELGYPKPYRYDSLLRGWDKLLKKNKHLTILCARG
ncbi:unnamed protein product, partial [marine sediment metagenome]